MVAAVVSLGTAAMTLAATQFGVLASAKTWFGGEHRFDFSFKTDPLETGVPQNVPYASSRYAPMWGK